MGRHFEVRLDDGLDGRLLGDAAAQRHPDDLPRRVPVQTYWRRSHVRHQWTVGARPVQPGELDVVPTQPVLGEGRHQLNPRGGARLRAAAIQRGHERLGEGDAVARRLDGRWPRARRLATRARQCYERLVEAERRRRHRQAPDGQAALLKRGAAPRHEQRQRAVGPACRFIEPERELAAGLIIWKVVLLNVQGAVQGLEAPEARLQDIAFDERTTIRKIELDARVAAGRRRGRVSIKRAARPRVGERGVEGTDAHEQTLFVFPKLERRARTPQTRRCQRRAVLDINHRQLGPFLRDAQLPDDAEARRTPDF